MVTVDPVLRPRTADYGWAALAAFAALLLILNVLAAAWIALVDGLLKAAVGLPGILFLYWIAVGAWRRTMWARS